MTYEDCARRVSCGFGGVDLRGVEAVASHLTGSFGLWVWPLARGCRYRVPRHRRYRSPGRRAPVLGVADLRKGDVFRFRAPARAGSEHQVTVGSSPACDVRLDDPLVAARHCALWISEDRVLVKPGGDPDAETTVNGIPVHRDSNIELVQGAIVRLGGSALIALGHPVEPAPEIAARSLDEFVLASLRVHGSVRAAAAALGLPRSTFHDRVKRALAALSDEASSSRELA